MFYNIKKILKIFGKLKSSLYLCDVKERKRDSQNHNKYLSFY